ncbi:type II toxin-antitoxin system HicA family toxin [Methanosarcina spelaei]|nr:type II toxin-antitoxin system HicA family toxin [Methanosarcina spelaei]
MGFEQIRQKGSHLFLRHPDGRTTIIPVHSTNKCDCKPHKN